MRIIRRCFSPIKGSASTTAAEHRIPDLRLASDWEAFVNTFFVAVQRQRQATSPGRTWRNESSVSLPWLRVRVGLT
jgi:hypothetical protein